MKKLLLPCTGVLMLAGYGCDYFLYRIELVPHGGQMERAVTVLWKGLQGPDGAEGEAKLRKEVERIAKVYGVAVPAGSTIRTRFSGPVPRDVGGAGYYRQYTSRLGAACVYVERFRGDDDVAAALRRRRDAADALADGLIGWFASEMGKDPSFAKLRAFLDGPFRGDLKNLGVYLWLHGATRRYGKQVPSEMLARAALYFAERGYFSPDDAPSIARAVAEGFDSDEAEDAGRLMRFFQRLAARKMGTADGDPIPRALRFLSDAPTARKSLEAYLEGTEEFRKRLRQWEAQKKKLPPDEKPPDRPDALQVWGDELGALFDLGAAGTPDRLELKLLAPVDPEATNGQADEKARAITWSTEIGRPEEKGFPAVCFAAWSVPDEAFQTKRFGKVVLRGNDLIGYCLLRGSLTEAEARQWDAILDQVRPGDDAAAKVKELLRRAADRRGAPTTRYAKPLLDMLKDSGSKEPQSRSQPSPRP